MEVFHICTQHELSECDRRIFTDIADLLILMFC